MQRRFFGPRPGVADDGEEARAYHHAQRGDRAIGRLQRDRLADVHRLARQHALHRIERGQQRAAVQVQQLEQAPAAHLVQRLHAAVTALAQHLERDDGQVGHLVLLCMAHAADHRCQPGAVHHPRGDHTANALEGLVPEILGKRRKQPRFQQRRQPAHQRAKAGAAYGARQAL